MSSSAPGPAADPAVSAAPARPAESAVSAAPARHAGSAGPTSRSWRWLAFGVVITAAVMDLLDSTIAGRRSDHPA